MKPICVPCQRFYQPKKNGVAFVEGMPKFNGAESGTAMPHQWTPYKLWYGDKWQCRGCGSQIIVGVAPHPVSEHYQPDFATRVANHGATLQVNDC